MYAAITPIRMITLPIISTIGLSDITALSIFCAAVSAFVAAAQIFVQLAATANSAKAAAAASTSGPMTSILFATQLMASSSGCKAMIAILLTCVQTSDQVSGISLNFWLVSSAEDSSADLTTLAVSSPSCAMLRISPTDTPR